MNNLLTQMISANDSNLKQMKNGRDVAKGKSNLCVGELKVGANGMRC